MTLIQTFLIAMFITLMIVLIFSLCNHSYWYNRGFNDATNLSQQVMKSILDKVDTWKH